MENKITCPYCGSYNQVVIDDSPSFSHRCKKCGKYHNYGNKVDFINNELLTKNTVFNGVISLSLVSKTDGKEIQEITNFAIIEMKEDETLLEFGYRKIGQLMESRK